MQELVDRHSQRESEGSVDPEGDEVLRISNPTEEETLIRSTYTTLVKITATLYFIFASFAGMLIFVAASGK